VWEHNGGVIDERYAKEVPEDAALIGTTASLSLAELALAGEGLRRALDALVRTRRRE
jgi:hypothetical protein